MYVCMHMYYYDSFKNLKERIINSNSNDNQREQETTYYTFMAILI